LADVLGKLPSSHHKDLLVGFNTADDAGVFRINDHQALVQTVDFFPPIVDDPYDFGRIAAANALSDVWAMGGYPLTALNIVGFPLGTMPAEILTEILRGGSQKVEEAGAVVVGGHSIKDKELKYGLAVTGIVDPGQIITNGGAVVGDKLFLTKPLGTGLVTTGIKRNAVDNKLISLVTEQMATLNKSAAEIMTAHKARAATDVTGFGLLGHVHEMAAASKVSIHIYSSRLPLLPQALELAEKKMIPGGANDNREYLADKIELADSLDHRLEAVLYDPQTSGGLLIAIPEEKAERFGRALRDSGLPDEIIGTVEPIGEFLVVVE
jgi:selenide,water dikinase